ncbi:terpenoid synthase [Gymnopus androsaceus JB14]|uniref:Terpene synthase n=1 Tax=Gymnopus androsaceus JB14 TaxID=1447944 RepID=A0A6A4I0H2_9AGAR|nr:terpenoid synthase [Gymnopus androsaceus JB14]
MPASVLSAYSPTSFLMPDLEASISVLPERDTNPHHDEARSESRLWINQFNKTVYGPKMRTFMDNCNLELINSFCYPYANKDGLRATMDLHNILWLYDEFTDTESGKDAHRSASVAQQALCDPEFNDGSWLCLMMKDFKTKHIDRAGPDAARRFIEHFCSYVKVVGKEAELREENKILDIQDYITLRRETSAVRTCFDLVEYCLGINLPQDVHEDPVFIGGYNAAMDLIYWANDLYSYNMEQAKGHSGANVITVIMKNKHLELQAAADFLGGYFESLIYQWKTAREVLALRSSEKYTNAVTVLDAYGDWVRGNVLWSFTTERYFGTQNTEIRKTRCVGLRLPFEESVNLTE